MKRVAIIGGGVMGMGAAVRIKEAYPLFEVTVIAKDLSPNTTGDGSAGLWTPFILGETPDNKIIRWSGETHRFFEKLWREGVPGVCLIPVLNINNSENSVPSWYKNVYGFHNLTAMELEAWSKFLGLQNKSGYHYVSFTYEPKMLLPYLKERFTKAGGKIKIQEVKSLSEVTSQDYNIVINCTGLGSRILVPDKKVIPIRGQVTRVNAPWMYHVIMDDSDDGNYIIPNTNSVVLGGTHQENNFNLNVCLKDHKFIMNGCQEIIPGLKHADTIQTWVGLRPGRDSVRLERENAIVSNASGKSVILIHNYGHGGSGVTLFWGCAGEILEILGDTMVNKSKL